MYCFTANQITDTVFKTEMDFLASWNDWRKWKGGNYLCVSDDKCHINCCWHLYEYRKYVCYTFVISRILILPPYRRGTITWNSAIGLYLSYSVHLIQHNVIKFVSDLQQIGGFLHFSSTTVYTDELWNKPETRVLLWFDLWLCIGEYHSIISRGSLIMDVGYIFIILNKNPIPPSRT